MAFSLKGKTILVEEYGLYLEHSLALAKAGAKILYFTPWAGAYSEFSHYAPGLGYDDEGIEKVYYFWPHVAEADMIYFPDVGTGAQAEYLRKTTDKPVFGSAIGLDGGDRLEQERWFMRGMQKELGMPTQETIRIKGIPKLREYLQKNPKKFVKLDKFRSDVESFYAKNYDEVKLYIDEIEVALGPFNEVYQFVIEPYLDGVEPGFDCFFTNGDWVKPYLWGVELNKNCYIGKFVEELPKPLQEIADGFKPLLKKIDYRGALSIEARVTKDGKAYLIDTCSRYPAPLSMAYPTAIENYAEVIWKVAAGETVRIKPNGKYVVAAPISTPHAKTHFVRLDFPVDQRKYIKLYISAKLNGRFYAVKGEPTVFVLVDSGDDYSKLITHIEELSKEIDSFELNTDSISGLNQIQEKVKKYPEFKMGEF